MRLRTFLLLDLIGTLLWVGLIVGLGYALGQRAVDVVGRINHYSLYLTLAVLALVIGVQVYRRRVSD
jgi:membrane protein DedA with SNARE-associated domain